MPKSAPEKLRRFYDQFEGHDHVLIVINADPDAIGSAMAVSRLLWRRVLNVTISNVNTINRPDNRAMLRLLDVTTVPFGQIKSGKYTKFVIVDSQPDHNEFMAQLKPDVIIDHHPDSKPKAPFVDIRPNYGATATILTEYLKTAGLKPPQTIATALFYGIKSDTMGLIRSTSPADAAAFCYLQSQVDMEALAKIEHAQVPAEYFKSFVLALQSARIYDRVVIAFLGPVDYPDLGAEMADILLRLRGIRWVVCIGTLSLIHI